MDCTEFDERFTHTVSASPILSAQLPPEAKSIVCRASNVKRNLYLETLSRLSIHPIFSSHILVCYEPLFPELVARWQTLATPIQMAATFGRVLPVVPYLAEMAEYFLMPKNGEKGLLSTIDPPVLSEPTNQGSLLEVLLALYRLLCFKREAFLPLVDAATLYQLLKHSYRPVRYVAIRILCIYLGVADAMQEDMFSRYGVGAQSENVMGAWEDREIDYGYLMVSEGRRCKELAERLAATKEAPSKVINTVPARIIQSTDFNSLIADLCGVLTPRLGGSSQNSVSIVDTPTTRSNIQSLALALRSSKPVLATGHAGSGKTILIHEIADNLNTLELMVSVHLGDQTDAKLLIGTYVTSSETPGSFEWRPGVLVTAVREGRWVLVEDIDKAPTEVLGVLLPLIERGELLLPSRGETIKAARGFRLVATVQTSASKKKDLAAVNLLGSRFWERVNVEMPSKSELEMIVNGRFPLLHAVASSVMNVYTTVQKLYQEPSFFAISRSSLGRQISSRDLFKWCTRIKILFVSAGVKTGNEALPDGLFDEVFREAVDCFAGSLHTLEAKRLVVGRIAAELHVPSQRLDLFLYGHHPGLKDSERSLVVGRARLKKKKDTAVLKRRKKIFGSQKRPFATTAHALRLMEQVGVAVRLSEPVLLVGETGTGKTTIVQHLADLLGYNITAINLSQQTESGDLLGGFKPVDVKSLAVPLKESFERLFESTFSAKKNKRFLEVLTKCWNKQQWKSVIRLWGEAVKMAENSFNASRTEPANQDEQKKKRKLDGVDKEALQAQWVQFAQNVSNLEKQSIQLSKSFAFSFVEGGLVKAARNGDWVLLDEINLASPDALESIADLLKDGGNGSIILSEKGDVERVKAHPDFRIFACMNPATDVGRRDLPPSLRSRFTELYVANPDSDLDNLLAIVKEYIGHLAVGDERVHGDVAYLYLEAKKLAEEYKLVDGANQRPHFSMRTLTRTLSYVIEIANVYGLRRSLYEGFCMSFLTLLDRDSEKILLLVIDKHILSSQSNVRSWINQIPRRPTDGEEYVQFKHYWMRRGAQEPQEQAHYIITPFVERNMLNLVRATATRKFPVLVQGPTSSGKTSMIEYLAKRTGNRFVRINNHEHTDLQEYMGTYVSDNDGQLTFREGILIEALRKGHWIVLDELNLAPTDVLEALNRLLDDNRELLVPETQEVVRPHKDFMLFATQNPPGLYGGRKNLSRAFRNRFLELHFDDIPEEELGTILKERCQIAPSYCERIVKVYKELSLLRQSSRLFEQKNSFATLRDLFRWGNREAVGYQQLAENGYMLLGERVRKHDEKVVVRQLLEKVMRVKIDEKSLYTAEKTPEYSMYQEISTTEDVVWTKAMRRLFALVSHALRNNEPVLLVGETGCGKTTVCQMLAKAFGRQLVIVNAHQNTETGDIIGAQRPKRNRSTYQKELTRNLISVLKNYQTTLTPEILEGTDLKRLLNVYQSLNPEVVTDIPIEIKKQIELNIVHSKRLFEWVDGPLIHAMKEGEFFLLDEISLADDSVLERLNSVLEPERGILLAEKGPIESQIKGAEGFQFLATMNPGGDYGKKELSLALRNRFTEIWVPPMNDFDDVFQIVSSKLPNSTKGFADAIVKYSEWFNATYNFSNTSSISIRDILAWIRFVNLHAHENPAFGLLHGAALVFFDGLGANPSALLTMSGENLIEQKRKCVEKLSELTNHDLLSLYAEPASVTTEESIIRLGAFSLQKKISSQTKISFNLKAPTTAMNAMRVARAMQLRRPILLEGSPGVGKTSLITALANATGNSLTRINLSEQTDLMDLFGSDMPVEGGQSGEFAWRDAPFLRAMQKGDWVLLDEMNLASQPVLEGLNACLDHRGEAYVAELDRVFKCHPNFVVFAAQNPHHQGSGRKGLPASFVNRFTVVYVESLNLNDLEMISTKLYPSIPQDLVQKSINFVITLDRELEKRKSFGAVGGPWEFNLRDTLRWLELLSATDKIPALKTPDEFIDIIIRQRFRTDEDRRRVDQIFEVVFEYPLAQRHFYHHMTDCMIQIGHAVLPRRKDVQSVTIDGLAILKRQLPVLETMMTCVQKNMPCILVGPSGSGKSTMIQLLAGLVGAEFDQFSLNNDVDTTDIVGGFEQVHISRKVSKLLEDVRKTAQNYINWFLQSVDVIPPAGVSNMLEFCRTGAQALSDLERLIQLQAHIVAALTKKTTELVSIFEPFKQRCEMLLAEAHKATVARFEWVDGLLVRAVEEGRWLVLDNANLCSPSVLDRLNSLLEVGGHLVVNEHSTPEGDPKIVNPHLDFRLFITMDPRHGELSRAMRNRCIEVYVEPSLSLPKVAEQDEEEARELARYSVAGESDTMMLQRLERIVLHAEVATRPEVFATLLRIALEHVVYSQNAASMLTRWSMQLRQQNNVIAVAEVENFLRFRANPKVQQAILQLLPSEGYHATTLNPLRNPYLPASASPVGGFDFLDLARQILSLSSIEEGIQSKSATTKFADLTFLERAASTSPKRRNFGGNIGTYLFEFLTALRELLEGQLSPRNSGNLQDLVHLWRDLVALSDTTATTLNESVFHVYLWLFQQWLDANTGADVGAVRTALAAFQRPLQLTSGLSMEAMWCAMRPAVPCDLAAWDQYIALQRVMVRFDAIRVDGNLTPILAPRKALAHAVVAVLTDNADVSELTAAMDEAVTRLEGARNAGLKEKSGRGVFTAAFDVLCKMQVLGGSRGVQLTDDTLRLWHYAGRSTASLVNVLLPSSAYDQVMEDFWVYPAEDKHKGPGAVYGGTVAVEMLDIKTSSQYAVIGQLKNLDLEIREIARQFVRQLKNVTASQQFALGCVLRNRIIQLAEIHKDSYDVNSWAIIKAYFDTSMKQRDCVLDVDHTQFEATIAALLQSHSSHFRAVVDQHLGGALRCMLILTSTTSYSDISRLGEAWTHYALAALKLYVPNLAFDPAMKPAVQRTRYQTRRTEFESELEAEVLFEAHFTGQGRNAKMTILEQRLAALGPEPADSRIARPEISQMGALQGDLSNLLSVVAAADPAGELISDSGKAQTQLLQTNLSTIVRRLEVGYPVYKDLLEPVVGFVYTLKTGLAMATAVLLEDARTARKEDDDEVLRFIDPLREKPDGGQDAQLLALRRYAARIAAEPGIGREANDTVQEIFQQLFTQWREQTEEDKKKAAAKASMYRYRGEGEDFDAREFRQMFPNYEENEDGGDADADVDMEKDDSEKLPEHQALAASIAVCQQAIFGNPEAVPDLDLSLKGLTREGAALWRKTAATRLLEPAKLEHLLPAIVLNLDSAAGWIHGTNPDTAAHYDFYTHANLAEAHKLVALVTPLAARLAALSERWPENITLQDALETCQSLLAFAADTPVARLLTKVEKLHGILHEWQQVAASVHSTREHFDQLTALLISWRKLELTTWPRLFAREDEHARTAARGWWFFVYESVIGNPLALLADGRTLAEHVRALVPSLVAFVTTASVGQYPHRLALLRAFVAHLSTLPQLATIHRAIANVVLYYEQYLTPVAGVLAAARKKAEKEVVDVVLLASWKDANILALRDSAKRSHHKLYKTVRKYRQALDGLVASLVADDMPAFSADASAYTPITTTATTATTPTQFNEKLVRTLYEPQIKPWTMRPARLQSITTTVDTMSRIAALPASAVSVASHLNTFTSDLLTTMADLQSQAIPNGSKEAAKHLKTRKRAALADTLRTIRGMGLTSNLSRAAMARQGTFEDILTTTAALRDMPTISAEVSEGLDKYFVRGVEALMKARTATKDHSSDLERSEVARCSGYLEHFTAVAQDERVRLTSAAAGVAALREAAARFGLLARVDGAGGGGGGGGGGYSPMLHGRMTVVEGMLETHHRKHVRFPRPTLTVELVQVVRRTLGWLPPMLDFALELVRVHAGLAAEAAGGELATVERLLVEWKLQAVEIARVLEAGVAVIIHEHLWTAATKDSLENATQFLTSLHSLLGTSMKQSPDLRYIMLPLHAFTDPAYIRNLVPYQSYELTNEQLSETSSLQALDKTLEDLTSSVFVALQHLKKALASTPTDTNDQGWLLVHQTSSTAALKALHLQSVYKKLIDVLSFAASVWPRSEDTSKAVRAVFASYWPVVSRYVQICEEYLQRLASEHRAALKTTYILCTSAATLFVKGFCQPIEGDDSAAEGGQGVESGTGLGEGEGGEDISKDIKDDEDLAGLAQETKKEEREEEIEDEDDAVDMAGEDMEGEIGNMEQKDDGENGDEKEEDETNIDQEVGDVDDLDPTAVNEKMWNAPEGEDEEMKENECGDAKLQKAGDESEAKREGDTKGEQGDPKEAHDEEEQVGMDQDDEVKQQDAESMGGYVPEIETLELPEDLDLDGGDEKDSDDGDLDMDDLSDVEQEDNEKMKDVDNEEEKFPKLDGQQVKEMDTKSRDEEAGEDQDDKNLGDAIQDTDLENGGSDREDDVAEKLEDDNLLQTCTEDNLKSADETALSEVQGVQGGDNAKDSKDSTATAQQEDGEENRAEKAEQTGKGKTNDHSAEEQVGQADQHQVKQNSERKEAEEDGPSQKEQEFRKMGDILEKWHRQRKEIINAKEEDDESQRSQIDMELDDPEFEHLPNDNATADTQALGVATEEQASVLDDESMAIDSGTKEPMPLVEGEDEQPQIGEKKGQDGPEVVEHSKEDDSRDGGEEIDATHAGAIVGEIKESAESRRQASQKEGSAMDLDEDAEGGSATSENEDMDWLQTELASFESTRPHEEARALWQHHESNTRPLSGGLTEQLRLILEPTQAAKMRGDFRTGKRLNLRRILPYIASEYKKDKIWMRRAKPSKRQYQVILAVDDSKSMAESSTSDLALETVALVARALSSLEVGQISILSFGEQTRVVHPFHQPFTADSGVAAFERFTFAQKNTDVLSLMSTSLSLFANARASAAQSAPMDLWQLEIIISDGVCESHDALRRLVRKAQEQRVMVVFVIVDSTREGSVLELNRVTFVDGEVHTERYLDGFPFAYYLVVRDVKELPGVLSGALRSWFAESVDIL